MKKKRPQAVGFEKILEALIAQGGINLEALAEITKHHEVIAKGCGPVIEPFLRDLLLLGPADEHERPRPDWVTNAVLHIQSSIVRSGMCGKSDDLAELLGTVGGAVLGLNHTPSPFEKPSPEVQASWEALTSTVGRSVQEAQQQANALPKEERTKFYAGFARGTDRDLLQDGSALLGSYADLYLIAIWGWREIIALRTRREFQAWLENRLGSGPEVDAKRVDRFCEQIGLKFKDRGRPKKNTQS